MADPRCLGAVLVLPAALLSEPLSGCSAGPLSAGPLNDARVARVAGGARRCDSVLCGLEALRTRAGASDWVLVHDAARPCLTASDLNRLLTAGREQTVGALLAAPVTDTIKQATTPMACVSTVDRATLWRALTPQMFRYAPLCAALRSAVAGNRAPTDEAEAFEWQGAYALLVPALENNIKITTAEDLTIAAAVLDARTERAERAEREES